MNALAGLNTNAPAVMGQNVASSFVAGGEFADNSRLRKAMATIAVNPDDPEAMRVVMELDPATGAKLQASQQERQFGQAAVDYVEGGRASAAQPQPNALAAMAMRGPQPRAVPAQRNALMPVDSASSSGEGFAPLSPPMPARPAGPTVRADAARDTNGDGEIDFAPLGEVRTAQDEAFLRMVRIDPKQAFAIEGEMRDRAADRLKFQRDAYGYAVSRLGGVTKDAEYGEALADIQARIDPLGVSVSQFLPDRFPGPDALRQIRLSAIDAEDQTRLFMQQANIDADNARADRNTDSMIDVREGRLAEYQRANRAREGNQRRGQDMSSRDRRRGQDMRGSGRGGRSRVPVVSSPDEARSLPPGTEFRVKGTNRILRTPGG